MLTSTSMAPNLGKSISAHEQCLGQKNALKVRKYCLCGLKAARDRNIEEVVASLIDGSHSFPKNRQLQ